MSSKIKLADEDAGLTVSCDFNENQVIGLEQPCFLSFNTIEEFENYINSLNKLKKAFVSLAY